MRRPRAARSSATRSATTCRPRDIERENPLYPAPVQDVRRLLRAAARCWSPPAEIDDPADAATSRCAIERGGQTLYEGSVNTRRDEAARPTSWWTGSAAATSCPARDRAVDGHRHPRPGRARARRGDVVEITLERVGTLRNPGPPAEGVSAPASRSASNASSGVGSSAAPPARSATAAPPCARPGRPPRSPPRRGRGGSGDGRGRRS